MLIKDVRIINFDNTISNADIEIENNIIKAIKPKSGKGNKIVIPGFIDMHIHGFQGKDAMDGQDAIEFMSKHLALVGTTSFLPTLMTEKSLLSALANAAKAQNINTRILGFHLEGPFLSIAKKGAHNEKYIEKATLDKVLKLISLSENRIRKMTIAPENFELDLISILIENQIVISLGHTNIDANEAESFFKNGVSSVTHLWNAMTGIVNRKPGLVAKTLISKNIMAEVIADFVHIDPISLKLTIEAKGVETITLVTDAIRPSGLPDGDSMSGGLKVVKKGNLITLKEQGTIAGSGITMYDNFKNIIDLGYDLEAAVAMTSYNAATLLGEDFLGQVRENCWADLIILNNDLTIDKVFVNGKEIN